MRTGPSWAKQVVVGWTLVASAAIAGDAGAQERRAPPNGSVALEVKACPTVSTDAIRRALGVEIGELLLGASDSTSGAADRLVIRCAGSFAWLEATGPADGGPLARMIRLDDYPGDAAPRALALTGLELLAARSASVRERIGSTQAQSAPAPAPPREAPSEPKDGATAPAPTSRPAASLRRSRIGLAGSWRTFLGEHGPSTWGGQLEAGTTLTPTLQIAVDAGLGAGRREVQGLGETRALLVSTGATIGLYMGTAELGSSLGLGGRIGLAQLSGVSTEPATVASGSVWRPWGGPAASAGFFGGFGQAALALTLEAGLSLLSPEGQAGGATAISLGGAWVSVILGPCFRP